MNNKGTLLFLLITLSAITFGVVRGYHTGVIAGEASNNHFEWQLQNYEGTWGSAYYMVTFPVSVWLEKSVYFRMQPASFHMAFGGLSIIMWLAIITYLMLRSSEVSEDDYASYTHHAKPKSFLPTEVEAFIELVTKVVIASGLVQGRPIVAVEKFIEKNFGLSDDQVVKAMRTFNFLMFSQASGRGVDISRVAVPKKLRQQNKEVFDFFCALVGDDGVFTKDELLVLEELRIRLDLGRADAHTILRSRAVAGNNPAVAHEVAV